MQPCKLHYHQMKSPDKTETLKFVLSCILCFQGQPLSFQERLPPI